MVNFHSSRLIFLKFQVLKCILGVLASKDFHEISQICSADEYLSSTMHIFSSELYLDAIFCKKLPFLAKKSASNFFGPQLGKTKLIFLFYTFFRTSMQKIGDGYFFFQNSWNWAFGLADIWPQTTNTKLRQDPVWYLLPWNNWKTGVWDRYGIFYHATMIRLSPSNVVEHHVERVAIL